MTLSMLGFGLVVLLACTTQALAGFGSTIICITLAALWLPIPWVMPIVVALNVPFTGWLVWQERRHIEARLLLRQILPLMSVGAIIGALCVPLLTHAALQPAYGALIVALSLLDLWRLQRRRAWRAAPATRVGMLAAAGFVQGLYASGGPLLAAAMAGSGLSKAALRATMLCVWLTLNLGLTLWLFSADRYAQDMLWATAALLPVSFLGLWLGNRLHQRIDERQYRLLIDVLLLVAGLALLLK